MAKFKLYVPKNVGDIFEVEAATLEEARAKLHTHVQTANRKSLMPETKEIVMTGETVMLNGYHDYDYASDLSHGAEYLYEVK